MSSSFANKSKPHKSTPAKWLSEAEGIRRSAWGPMGTGAQISMYFLHLFQLLNCLHQGNVNTTQNDYGKVFAFLQFLKGNIKMNPQISI